MVSSTALDNLSSVSRAQRVTKWRWPFQGPVHAIFRKRGILNYTAYGAGEIYGGLKVFARDLQVVTVVENDFLYYTKTSEIV